VKKLYQFILKKTGWTIAGNTGYPDKCILCVAPHTSNWDFILGKLVYASMGKKAKFLMKKTWFFFPMNILLKAIGGIPVDRTKKTSLTEQLVELFSQNDQLQIAITPEGTRKKSEEWKKGFYYIAYQAKIPIIIVVVDYRIKTVDFRAIFNPTGDADTDIEIIKNYYKGAQGKHPENFSITQ